MKEIGILICGFAIAVLAFIGGQVYTGEVITKPVNKEYTETKKYAEYNPDRPRQADPPQVQTKVIYKDRVRYIYKKVKPRRNYERHERDWRDGVFQ